MTLENKAKLSLIIFLGISILIIVFSIYPLFKSINDNAVELSFKKQDVLYLDNKLENIDEFKRNYKEIKGNLEKGENLFATSEAPVDFIGFLEEISKNTYVSIKMAPSPLAKSLNDPWFSMVFQIKTVSSFRNFLEFIEKLETGPYLTQIKSLNIVRLTKENLRAESLSGYSIGDARGDFSVKVFANKTLGL
ncbi:MAG: hypothetical protein KJI70_02785 [Patescibacteria group bacterium]|nr:hypothetical protein [Patescibacteria group bacterium]